MVTARYELLSWLLAFLVGGLLLRNVFLAERPPTLNIEGFTDAKDLRIAPGSAQQGYGLQNTANIAPGNYMEEDFIWFATRNIGDEIVFELFDVEPGLYALELFMATSGDFGIVRATLNDQVLAQQIDLHPSVFQYKSPVKVDQVSLLRDNHLRLSVVGANPATSAPHYQIGIDGISLRRLTP